MSIAAALLRPCLVDTSLLTNFLYSGHISLLRELVGQPLCITPSILDPSEIPFVSAGSITFTSEVFRPLSATKEKQERYKDILPHISSFARQEGALWTKVDLSSSELALALSFRDRAIWDSCPAGTRKRKRGLGAGEAEVVAVTVSRKWTALLDDQAAVDLLRGLWREAPILRTCALIVHAVISGLIDCKSAERLFNENICKDLLFNCINPDTGNTLRLKCDPPRCEWLP
ncbi:MAG: hypothetical protein U0105_21360 [Candidatus Obscuribacterales bacterium]